MTQEQPPTIVDAILHSHRQAGELVRALSLGARGPEEIGTRFEVATRLCALELLADVASSLQCLRDLAPHVLDARPAETFADRTLDLALGASPELLSTMLSATESRLEAEQRENERLRARLAAFEPPPPVGIPAVDPEGDPQ